MSNKLTYKKVFVNSAFRLPQSASSADFSIELQENFETPEGTRLYVSDVSIGAVWKTTEIGFFEYLYVMVYDNDDNLVKNFRHYLGNAIYFAEQFCYDIVDGMNSNTTDLSAGGIFVYSYSSATRTVEIKVKDGLNYKIKIPTDEELSNYVNNSWNTTTYPYDNNKPVSINYLLSNYVATSPIATWTSSYLNLVPFHALYISSSALTDYKYSAPNSYSSSIIKKIPITQQLGGVINDLAAPMSEDYIDIGNKNLKKIDFKITDQSGTVMNLYNIPVELTLIFAHSSY